MGVTTQGATIIEKGGRYCSVALRLQDYLLRIGELVSARELLNVGPYSSIRFDRRNM